MEQFYTIEFYEEANGKQPFKEWFFALKDKRARVRLQAKIDRVAYGNFGDWKRVEGAQGLCELRDHYGPGYRIYYTVVGSKLVVLLAGSTKSDQTKMIAKAKRYLADLERRLS